MPDIVACPSCGGKLRIAEELHGQKVRCPTCNHIFDSAAEMEHPADPFRAPHDLPLDLTLDEPSSSPAAPPSTAPGPFGAVELTPFSEQPASAETPAGPPPQAPPRRTDKRLDHDLPSLRRLRPRLDTEPDRGAVVLALGIISLALILVWCATPVGAILGLVAWIMGQIDLRKMKSGQMDDQNRGMTQAGWICGILGTVLNGLVMLGCGMFIGAIWFSEMSRVPNTQPIPKTQPVVPKRLNPPPRPNNPKQKEF